MKILRNLWKRKFDFKGVATTKEFFQSLLANWVAMMALLPVPVLMCVCFSMLGIAGDFAQIIIPSVSIAYMGVFLIPIPALTVRRMRNSGHPLWYQILMVIGIPVYGFLLIGILKPETWIHCFLTKLGRILLLICLGGFLWSIPLFSLNTEAFDICGMILLSIGTVGIIIGGIGGKMDEQRNKAASRELETEEIH